MPSEVIDEWRKSALLLPGHGGNKGPGGVSLYGARAVARLYPSPHPPKGSKVSRKKKGGGVGSA